MSEDNLVQTDVSQADVPSGHLDFEAKAREVWLGMRFSSNPNDGINAIASALSEAYEAGRGLVQTLSSQAQTSSGHQDAILAENSRLRKVLEEIAGGLPEDIQAAFENLVAGGVEWGETDPQTDAEHVEGFAKSLAITRAHFELGGEARALCGVYFKGTDTVVCHTGTSPNSSINARIITGLLESTPRVVAGARAALAHAQVAAPLPQGEFETAQRPATAPEPPKAISTPETPSSPARSTQEA